jgi:hypothetical protein
MESNMKISQKAKDRIAMWSSDTVPRHLPKECKSGDTCTQMFTAALFIMARQWKQPRCPTTDKWIKEMWYIYIYNGVVLSHKE